MWHWDKRRGLILMRILIYGAGVIGSLYAALFAEAGYDTNIYARGKRLEALRNNGLQYKKNQEVIKAEIRILGELPNDDIYDFVLLTVRENQLYEALTELKNNKSNTIVTMINSLDSYNKWEDIVGNEYFSLFTLAIFRDDAGSYIWKQFWR